MPKQSSGEAAYAALLASIRNGDYHPGDRVREEEVAERLSLSRTPVREALRRLEADGIVEHRPRVGALIRQLSRTEVVELYEMRAVFERTAAEMAAKHGTRSEFDVLSDLNEQLSHRKTSPSEAAALNQEFHRGLYLAGRNRFLVEAARALNNSLLLLGPTTLTSEGRIETVHHQHQTIITALREGDAEAAGKAAEVHLRSSLRDRLKVVGL